jgi:hypothetical protein
MAEEWVDLSGDGGVLKKVRSGAHESLSTCLSRRPLHRGNTPSLCTHSLLTSHVRMMLQILQEGSGETPPNGDEVRAHYTGILEDGTKFDSSRDRGQEFKFMLGQRQVIRAWDIGFASMKVSGPFPTSKSACHIERPSGVMLRFGGAVFPRWARRLF